jgi:putative ABC transport system permease protein
LVKPKDFASAYALRAQYKDGTTTAAFPGEVLASLFGLFDEVKSALSLVTLAFQAVVFLSVILSLLASLPSKTRWIGLLRALGAGPGYIFLTLWIQSALILLVAGALGAGGGWVGAQTLAGFVAGQTGLALPLVWSAQEWLFVAAFGLLGAIGALVPALAGYATSIRRSLLGQ